MSVVATVQPGTRRTLFVQTAADVEEALTLFDENALVDQTGVESRTPPTACDGAGGEPGLDEMLVHLWEGLTAHRLVPCPVCGADMRPQYGVHARPIGGRCGDCGSTLG
jgi:hypothetical protein